VQLVQLWEYHVTSISLAENMTEAKPEQEIAAAMQAMGDDGWELVGVTSGSGMGAIVNIMLFWKREKRHTTFDIKGPLSEPTTIRD
jgi:hypothetical protein